MCKPVFQMSEVPTMFVRHQWGPALWLCDLIFQFPLQPFTFGGTLHTQMEVHMVLLPCGTRIKVVESRLHVSHGGGNETRLECDRRSRVADESS